MHAGVSRDELSILSSVVCLKKSRLTLYEIILHRGVAKGVERDRAFAHE